MELNKILSEKKNQIELLNKLKEELKDTPLAIEEILNQVMK